MKFKCTSLALSCNTSFSSSQVFAGFMDCTKLAGDTRGLRGRYPAPEPTPSASYGLPSDVLSSTFKHECYITERSLMQNLFFSNSTLRNNIPVGQKSKSKSIRKIGISLSAQQFSEFYQRKLPVLGNNLSLLLCKMCWTVTQSFAVTK